MGIKHKMLAGRVRFLEEEIIALRIKLAEIEKAIAAEENPINIAGWTVALEPDPMEVSTRSPFKVSS